MEDKLILNLKNKILEKISEEKLNKKIKKKIEELEGLISEESAIISIAEEMGFKYDEKDEYLIGRIKKIIPYKWFEKPDGKKGRVAKIILIDQKGQEKNIVLWHRESEKADKLRINDIIRINFNDLDEKNNEYHLKYGGKIEKYNEESNEIPKIKENIKRIFELTGKEEEEFNTYGKILTIFPKNENKNYLRMIIYDGVPIYLTIFNRFSNLKYKPGDIIKLENVKIFKNEEKGSFSLSLYDDGRVIFEKPKEFNIEEIFIRKNISELTEGGYYEIKGAITWIENKEYPIKITIDDGTDQIKGVFFNNFNPIKGEEYIFKGSTRKNGEYLEYIISFIEKIDYYKEMEKY